MENVIRIIHPVDPVDGLEAAFVKTGVVRYEGIVLQHRSDLLPDLRKNRGVLRVFGPQAVHLAAKPLIVFWLRMNERIEGIHDDIITDDDNTNRADAGRLLVSSLEIEGVEATELTHNSSAWPRYLP